MATTLSQGDGHKPLNQDAVAAAAANVTRWNQDRQGGETVPALKRELRAAMEKYCGVFRETALLAEGVTAISDICRRIHDNAVITDHSKTFNTARIEALELRNLADVAIATMASAHYRQESRGAHSRVDYPKRDDVNWLKHSLYFSTDGRMDFKPVRLQPLTVDSFPPKERVY